MYCGFILLQLLPMVGVAVGEEPTSLVGRLQHSAPAVKQINDEFQDAVSHSTTTHTDNNDLQMNQSNPLDTI